MTAPTETKTVAYVIQDAIGYAADAIRELVTASGLGRVELISGDLEKAEVAAARMLKRIKDARAIARRAERKQRK